MDYRIQIKEQANIEIIEAYFYYESKRKGLGEVFLAQLKIYFDNILLSPEHFPQKRKPYREVFINRFPYLIIYEIINEEVIVYSVFNTWQDPNKKPK